MEKSAAVFCETDEKVRPMLSQVSVSSVSSVARCAHRPRTTDVRARARKKQPWRVRRTVVHQRSRKQAQ